MNCPSSVLAQPRDARGGGAPCADAQIHTEALQHYSSTGARDVDRGLPGCESIRGHIIAGRQTPGPRFCLPSYDCRLCGQAADSSHCLPAPYEPSTFLTAHACNAQPYYDHALGRGGNQAGDGAAALNWCARHGHLLGVLQQLPNVWP